MPMICTNMCSVIHPNVWTVLLQLYQSGSYCFNVHSIMTDIITNTQTCFLISSQLLLVQKNKMKDELFQQRFVLAIASYIASQLYVVLVYLHLQISIGFQVNDNFMHLLLFIAYSHTYKTTIPLTAQTISSYTPCS